jgi:hypothetical protein
VCLVSFPLIENTNAVGNCIVLQSSRNFSMYSPVLRIPHVTTFSMHGHVVDRIGARRSESPGHRAFVNTGASPENTHECFPCADTPVTDHRSGLYFVMRDRRTRHSCPLVRAPFALQTHERCTAPQMHRLSVESGDSRGGTESRPKSAGADWSHIRK